MSMHMMMLSLLFLFQMMFYSVNGIVAGIDFGGEFFKVALVQPGSPFEIVTNIHSKRKTETMVAFDGGERFYGADALNIGVRDPKNAYCQIRKMLGHSAYSPSMQALTSVEYLPYELVQNVSRGTVGVKHGDEHVFHAEELVAMVFSHAKEITNAFAQSSVKDWVITVPSFFVQAQRQAILDAAEITGIRVLSLIDENTAAALQYGIDRVYEEPYRVVYYNMGSSSLQVSLMEYSSYTVPDGFKKNKTVGTFRVLAKAWDTTLGGAAFDLRLAEHIADEVNVKLNLGEEDIRTFPRPMAKIRALARKTKVVLSANEQIPIVMQSLHQDKDFFSSMTRASFENICSDLFARALAPLEKVLADADLNINDLDELEIIGGAVRMPKIQKMLKSFWKSDGSKELGVHLNGDEAMALGAAFRAANISNAFRVRQVGMEDGNAFSMGVRLTDLVPSTGEDEPWVKRASLFPSNSRLGARKAVSFTHDQDISCIFKYGEPSELPVGTHAVIAKYNITGVPAFMASMKEKHDLTGLAKITCSFFLDASGMIQLDKVEASMEQEYQVEEEKKEEEKKEDDVKKDDDAKKEDDVEAPKVEMVMVTKTKVHKERLVVIRSDALDEGEDAGMNILPMTILDKTESVALLKEMQRRDDIRMENDQAKNNLESFVYASRSSLRENEEEIVSSAVASQVDVDELSQELDDTEEWLYDEGDRVEASVYTLRKREMKNKLDGMLFRVKELTDRPAAVRRLESYGTATRDLMEEWSVDKPQILESEREVVITRLEALEKWVAEQLAEQALLKMTDTPAFASNEVVMKLKELKRYVTSLSKRPKPEPVVEKEPEEEVKDGEVKDGEVKDGEAKDGEAKKEEDKEEEPKTVPEDAKDEEPLKEEDKEHSEL